MWKQYVDPFDNIALSAALAAAPILFLFWALAIRRMKGHVAGPLTLALAFVLAVAVYRMPLSLALIAAGHGAGFALFPVGWIILPAVFLHAVTQRTGQFEALKESITHVSGDRRIQAMLIAFCFGALLEGTTGFGAPVAVSAGILAGLGFPAIEAATLCLVANTVPVAFASLGIPILVASQVTALPEMAISQMVGRQLPLLALLVPFWLAAIIDGRRGLRETWPAAAVSGSVFAIVQWWSSNYLGPTLPGLLSAAASIVALALLLRFWHPAVPAAGNEALEARPGFRRQAYGWSPYLILCVFVAVWGLPATKALLDQTSIALHVPILDGAIESGMTGKPVPATFAFNWLATPGTAIFLAASLSGLSQGIGVGALARLFVKTAWSLRMAFVTIAAMLAYAYLGNASGMTITLGLAIASTGALFPLLSPVLGWLGVLITGSDTSSNAIFGKLQSVTADKAGVDPVLMVAANCSGGVSGKMVSPQSLAIAAAAAGLAGKEPDLFRACIRHSLVFLAAIMALTFLQAHVLKGMIPDAAIGSLAARQAPAPSLAWGILATAGVAVTTILLLAKRPPAAS
ncbi:MAG TPA: lactate permease LctP family transporter [Candidatus Hydrogenedentes bacterium]|nr:lactate permease LctP family transporter [Candidatus Hydrogenedentota bacterium]